MKIKFDTDDHLLLNKQLKLHLVTIIIRPIFEEDDELYPQVFLGDALYDSQKCYSTKKLIFQKDLTLIKQVHQNNVSFVIIGVLKMFDLVLSYMFVINVMMFDDCL